MSKLRVSAKAVAIPIERPTRISTRVLSERHYLLVDVESEHGNGIGYAYAGTSGGPILAQAVDELLAPMLEREGAEDLERTWQRLYQETLLSGRRGMVVRALSAVDTALWDLRAKACDVPLAVLLGGDVARPLPAYASGGYYRPGEGSPADTVTAEIEENRAEGFTDHKIKVGGLPIAEDAERVAAAFAAMGPDDRLALDANNAYRTPTEAIRAARAFERAADERGIWWFEEPLSPDDITGHAEVARVLETPVATGEIHQTRWEFARLIDGRAADLLQPDAGVIGGVTEWVKVAHLADSHGIQVAPHWHANLHAQLGAAISNTVAIEHFSLKKDIYNFERLLTEESRLEVRGGAVHLTARPGLGIEWDQAAVDRFAISRT
ncbi:mandelate racemase/muconate lactonizing enzyme family protein [Microbacterium soli]|uniref:Mandelate racemase/muconate lactonizing enzyme family protein n=1 Tax=Microbacterium soli TaxID=446075 RepID=A0ABP7N5B6_9MICO